MTTPHLNTECIIRCYASGVFFGTVASQDGRQIEIVNARRLWRWKAVKGIELIAVAVHGIVASMSRVSAVAPSMTVLDALEIIPATPEAAKTIREAPDAEA